MSALRMLGEMGIIDPLSSAFGVARLYLHRGLDAMTQEQRIVFDQQVAPILLHKCGRCDDYVQVSTLPDAYEQGSMLCSRHLSQRKGRLIWLEADALSAGAQRKEARAQ